MSRQARPNADRAAQNAQTLKALIKLEGNKVCADCKRNKHPRWASWNLGVFVCIRCSGIHRGMGTHISRVKSVDLDAWTDEQLQSILKWGNKRANKYWEAKLAPGHAPSEAKIENFIRTKYETKRWVMDGPMPDPSTLDEGDDDVPLNIVQEKAKMERSASLRTQANPQAPPPRQVQAAKPVNLFDDDITPGPPARPNTADIPDNKPTKTGPAPAPKPSRPQDSLLGLDFFGGPQQAGIGRPSSAASNPVSSTNARGDLKQSILSLYSSAPKPQTTQQPTQGSQPPFGGMSSPPIPQADAFGGLADAFGGMNFSNTTTKSSPPQPTPSAFRGMKAFPSSMPPKAAPSAPKITSPPPLSGGNFFDSFGSSSNPPKASIAPPVQSSGSLDFGFAQKPTATPAVPAKQAPTSIPTDLFANDDFGGFASSAPPPPPARQQPTVTSPPPLTSQNDFGSGFDFSSSTSQPSTTGLAAPTTTFQNDFTSPFNLSSPTASAPPPVPAARSQPFSQPSTSMIDPWGSGADNNAWGAPDPVPSKVAAPKVDLGSVPTKLTPNDIAGGWGSPISSANKSSVQPTVAADEDFGGWTSAASPGAAPGGNSAKNNGFGSSSVFDNPWG